MTRVTSELQITVPTRIAEQYGIEPGDEVAFQPAGDIIQLMPVVCRTRRRLSHDERLRLFDAATARQREREERMRLPVERVLKRDWRREDLYDREAAADDGEHS